MAPARARTHPLPLRDGMPLQASRFTLRDGNVDAPPAKLPVRSHELTVIVGHIMIIESMEAPNFLPD